MHMDKLRVYFQDFNIQHMIIQGEAIKTDYLNNSFIFDRKQCFK